MGRLASALFGAGVLLAPLAARAQEPGPGSWNPSAWAAASASSGPPRSIGGTELGGAQALPADGPGWQAVRLSRNRNWGHPALLELVRGLTAQAAGHGLPMLWIGDLGQPRGGPLPYGHASHQNGLDVDIWLDLSAKPPRPAAAREAIAVASLVLPDEAGIDRRVWRPQHATLIRLAAGMPGVDRVLVNHAIKRELCRTDAGAAWLRRVRPWRGHDEHMHVRLRCPEGQPECRDQAPPPPGDGCDASLAWWLTPEARRPAPRPGGVPPVPPAACAGLLETR